MATKLKNTLAASAVVALCATGASATSFDISFTNNAFGDDIFFTPVFSALHDGTFNTFDNQGTASAGLEVLAEDGGTGGVQALADAAGAVAGTIGGVNGASGNFNGTNMMPPLFEPGETSSINLDASSLAGGPVYFSYLSMILPSNDFFIGNSNELEILVVDGAGNFQGTNGVLSFDVLYTSVYDAGTEENSTATAMGELANAPFAAGGQSMPNQGPTEGEVIRRLADTAGLNLLNIVGTQTPGGEITLVPSGAAGRNLLGTFTISVAQVPLPAAAPLLIAGVGGLAMASRRKKKQS